MSFDVTFNLPNNRKMHCLYSITTSFTDVYDVKYKKTALFKNALPDPTEDIYNPPD